MKCQKCGDSIEGNDVYGFLDKNVCDDCYIDLMAGMPEVEISVLPEHIQSGFMRVRKGWNRDRPNKHHFLNFRR